MSKVKKKKNQILCIDGDGSMLMHLGNLLVIKNLGLNNFKHILKRTFLIG